MAGSTPGPAKSPGHIYLGVERTPIMRLARSADNRSWVAGIYGAIYRANLAIAHATQARAKEILADSIVRPSQRTGQLEKAVADPRAVYADGSRIVIGVGDFLDHVVRYWRAVEEGAPRLADIVWYGWWVNAPKGSGFAGADMHGPLEGVRTGRPIVASTNAPPANIKHFFTWQIKNVPDGKFFFAKAWDEMRSGGLVEEFYRRELAQVTGPNGRPLVLSRLFRAGTGQSLSRSSFGV